MPVRSARSAGGVVVRQGAHGPEVAVCIRNAESLVCLPKGTPEPGESEVQTAVREVQEETGLQVEAGDRIGSNDYWFVRDGARIHKVVRWWVMKPVGGSVEDHDHEFDAVEWLPAGEALARLTYPDERAIVEKALQLVDAEQQV